MCVRVRVRAVFTIHVYVACRYVQNVLSFNFANTFLYTFSLDLDPSWCFE